MLHEHGWLSFSFSPPLACGLQSWVANHQHYIQRPSSLYHLLAPFLFIRTCSRDMPPRVICRVTLPVDSAGCAWSAMETFAESQLPFSSSHMKTAVSSFGFVSQMHHRPLNQARSSLKLCRIPRHPTPPKAQSTCETARRAASCIIAVVTFARFERPCIAARTWITRPGRRRLKLSTPKATGL